MDRYQTNVTVLNKFAGELDFSEIYISTGEDFPDALAGSVLAPRTGAPIMLTSAAPQNSTKDFFNSRTSSINKVSVFGGTGVVPESSLQTILSQDSVGSNNNVVDTEGNSPANAIN